jgi:hypothetical protein
MMCSNNRESFHSLEVELTDRRSTNSFKSDNFSVSLKEEDDEEDN